MKSSNYESVSSPEAAQVNAALTSGVRLVAATLVLLGGAAIAQAADLTGKWIGTNHTITVYCSVPPESTGSAEMEIVQAGDTFTGTYLFTWEDPESCIPATAPRTDVLDISGTVDGDSFTATVTMDGQGPSETMTGSVTGNAMSFTWIWPTDDEHDAYPEELIDSIVTGQLTRVPTAIIPSAAVNSLWPPNSRMVDIGLVLDDTATFIVYSDEDDGRTADASGSLFLRAERAGTGDGRVYLIAITSDDGSQTCFTAVVPKSQSESDLASADDQAAEALAQCPSTPAGYFVIER